MAPRGSKWPFWTLWDPFGQAWPYPLLDSCGFRGLWEPLGALGRPLGGLWEGSQGLKMASQRPQEASGTPYSRGRSYGSLARPGQRAPRGSQGLPEGPKWPFWPFWTPWDPFGQAWPYPLLDSCGFRGLWEPLGALGRPLGGLWEGSQGLKMASQRPQEASGTPYSRGRYYGSLARPGQRAPRGSQGVQKGSKWPFWPPRAPGRPLGGLYRPI